MFLILSQNNKKILTPSQNNFFIILNQNNFKKKTFKPT
jgi:hypothetical protein